MNETDRIIDRQIEEEVKNSFLGYSMSVIVSRALPDVRDGLKPVHRRILYSMWEQKMFSNGGFYKSARIVGDVIGKYHPHGDTAVYDAMVRLAQEWNVMAKLIDGQGNFGSMDGDGAAAMRYTEAKLNKISEELLKNIEKNNVPFRDNYDGRAREPVVLPSRFPNLLVNGTRGIAVGMASNMPTHNLIEACDAVISYIKNPEITVDKLMEIMPGPDFPTGGIILGKEGIKKAYETGAGSITIRGSAHVEEMDNSLALVITQIPYQVNKSKLVEDIKEIQRLFDTYKQSTGKKKRHFSLKEKPKKALDFAKKDGVFDQSDSKSKEDNVRIVIQLKDGVHPKVVLNHLYKYTQLQETFSVNNTALIPSKNGLKPKRLKLKELIHEYVKHQMEVIKKETEFDLEKHKKDLYETEAMIKALKKIDETIEIIKQAKTHEEAVTGLMNLLSIDKEQANYILNKRIRTLTGYQQEEIKTHYEFLLKEIDRLSEILADDEKVKEIIVDELEKVKEQYGRERRTIISDSVDDFTEEDLIQNKQVVVTLSKKGYIKSTEESKYKLQRRNGRGVSTMNLDKDDVIVHLEIMYTHDNLLLFTNKGKVYQLKGYDIPETRANSKGFHIYNLLPGIEEDEVIQSVISVKVFSDKQYLFFATSKGVVKKTPLSEYRNIRRTGIIAIDLDEKDSLINVSLTDGNMNIILVTKNGKSITFHEGDVRPTSRSTLGVRGIKLEDDDVVVTSDIHESFGELFIVTEQGFGKRTSLDQYKVQKRGGSGIIALKSNKKTGKIVSAVVVTDDDSVYILSSQGSLIKMVANQISKYNRLTQGTKVINLKDNDFVIAAARLSEDEEQDEILKEKV